MLKLVLLTVSIWNIFNYCEMFDWMYDNGFISRETPACKCINHPDFASIKILPNDSRPAVIKEMKKYIAKFSSSEDDIHLRNDSQNVNTNTLGR